MIPYGKHHIDESDIDAVVNVLKHGSLTQGKMVEEFERAVAGYVNARYAVAVSSGTAALHIAMLAAESGPDTTFITTPITFVATANAAMYCGAKVEFVDIEPDSINPSISELLEASLKCHSRRKVICPVHFAGLPCDVKSLRDGFSGENNIIIEDAAHALGASYDSKNMVGSCVYSDMTCFSFHPVKSIAAGEGGMVTTNSERLYRRLIRLRSHGINKLDDSLINHYKNECSIGPWYYEMQQLGYNYRISDIHCALGLSQLKRIDKFVQKRRSIAERYFDLLAHVPYVKPAQLRTSLARSACHIFPVRVDYATAGISRAELMTELKSEGIGTQVHYIPVPTQPYYINRGYKFDWESSAADYYRSALSLPLYYELQFSEQDFVIDKIIKILNS